MATYRVHKTSKGEKRWRWRVSVAPHPPRYGTCPTKECARECAEAAESELRQGRPAVQATLSEVIDRYSAEHLSEIERSSKFYLQHLAWWRQVLGRNELNSITPQIIASARTLLSKNPGPTGRARSNPTINRYVATLSSLYSWACRPEIGLAASNPVRHVAKFKEPKGRVRWLSRPIDEDESEIERLLAACRDSESTYLLDAVLLLLSTGCRENEILSLTRRDIRLAERGFTIPAARAKTGESRFVALEGVGFEIVKRRLETIPPGADYLFPGDPGRPAGFPWRAWRTALRRANIENFRPHDLRHTHGSYLAMIGKTLPEIMQALGHKRPETAMRYIHLADGHKRRVAADVNEAIARWIGTDFYRAP